MLRLLAEEPRSVSWLASRLDIPANRAHYHLQQLVAQALVIEVGTGPRRWNSEERFYIAAARHFFVDPSLGAGDDETAAALARAADAVFLDLHRRRVIEVDFAQIAARSIQHSLRVRRGENVLVMFSPYALELAEAMIVEAEAAGAAVRVRPWSRNYMLRMVDRRSAGELASLSFIPGHVEEGVDAIVFIHSLMSQGAPPSPEQMAKVTHHLKALSRWSHSNRARGVRQLMMTVPYRAEMALAAAGPDAAADVYWRSMLADNADLHFRGQRLLTRAAGGCTLRIRCPRGTDFTMPFDPSLTQISDGLISEADVEAKSTIERLPSGEVVFLPGAEPAHGVFIGDYALVSGTHCRGVRVVVRDGCIQELDCESNADVLRRRFECNIGAPGAVGTLSIGLNPVAKGVTGKHALDSCAEGNVTLAFGNNEMMGGSIASTFSLILPATGVSAAVGQSPLVSDGNLV